MARCESCMGNFGLRHQSDIRFFKFMIGPNFSKALIWPQKIAERVKDLVNQEVRVEDANGIVWVVTLCDNYQGNLVAFDKGWSEFVALKNIQIGDTLLFDFLNNGNFFVLVFGRDGVEKRGNFAKTNPSFEGNNQTTNPTENVILNVEKANASDTLVVKKRKRSRNSDAGEVPSKVTCNRVKRTKQASDFDSDSPRDSDSLHRRGRKRGPRTSETKEACGCCPSSGRGRKRGPLTSSETKEASGCCPISALGRNRGPLTSETKEASGCCPSNALGRKRGPLTSETKEACGCCPSSAHGRKRGPLTSKTKEASGCCLSSALGRKRDPRTSETKETPGSCPSSSARGRKKGPRTSETKEASGSCPSSARGRGRKKALESSEKKEKSSSSPLKDIVKLEPVESLDVPSSSSSSSSSIARAVICPAQADGGFIIELPNRLPLIQFPSGDKEGMTFIKLQDPKGKEWRCKYVDKAGVCSLQANWPGINAENGITSGYYLVINVVDPSLQKYKFYAVDGPVLTFYLNK